MSKIKNTIQLLFDRTINILQTQYKGHFLKEQWLNLLYYIEEYFHIKGYISEI